jgi:para-nitrobenzyl esterase
MNAAENANVTVDTELGRLSGVRTEGLCTFKGVPFAEPPVGDLRFKAPRLLRAWSGTREAGPTAPASFQMSPSNAQRVSARIKELDPGVQGILPWPSYVKDAYSIPNVSEDCLYLSIWTPSVEPGRKLPVYIYFHGGANAVSSGSLEIEDGANFARHNQVVVVKPNYRLGALAWVHFGLLADCDDMAEAVNLGLQDQIAALEWVHRHIEAFGGDSANITVGGESAGATAVSHFLTNARARKYFKRAVIQSFTPFNNWCTSSPDDAKWVAKQYLKILGMSSSRELLRAPAEDLLAVQNIMTRYYSPDRNVAWRPLGGVVDGKHVQDFPARLLSEETVESEGLEVIIGFAKDEWQFFRGHAPIIENGSLEDVLRFMEQVLSPSDAHFIVHSFSELPRNQGKPWGQVLSDIMSFVYFKLPSLWVAERLAQQGIPVRAYQFSYDLPGEGGKYRALHTGNLPFLWLNVSEERLKNLSAFRGIDLAVAARSAESMVDRYSQFLHGEAISDWACFDTSSRSVLWFGEAINNQPGLADAEIAIFKRLGITRFQSLHEKLVVSLHRARAEHEAKSVVRA